MKVKRRDERSNCMPFSSSFAVNLLICFRIFTPIDFPGTVGLFARRGVFRFYRKFVLLD